MNDTCSYLSALSFNQSRNARLLLYTQVTTTATYRITPLISTVLIARFVYNHSVNYNSYNAQKQGFIISVLMVDNHAVIRKSDKY